MKSIENNHIDDLIEVMETAITKLSDYSITLQQHGLDLQNSEVVKIQYKLKDHIKHLNTLSENKPIILPPDYTLAIEKGRNYGFAEATLYSLNGVKRKITSDTEYEDILQEINKEKHSEHYK